MNRNTYSGVLTPPSNDFSEVRDGRRGLPRYLDIDLSTARSAKALTALVINVSGNSFYCDANPSDGNALVHFQDTNFDSASTPLFVSAGSIFSVPFTQLLIENTAQIGKKIRIVYGVDIDFQPGSVAQQSISGSISTIEAVYGKSALSQAFTAYGNCAPIAGGVSQVALFNPANSGKYLYIDSLTISNGLTQQGIAVAGLTALGNLTLQNVGTNKSVGGANSVASTYTDLAVSTATITGAIYDNASYAITESKNIKLNSPIVVPPSFGAVAYGNTVNIGLACLFSYTEN